MIVAEVMTPNPHAVHVTDSVGRAWRMLSAADIRHLPVVQDGGILVGILSDRDLRPILPTALDELEHPGSVRALLEQPVSNVMSSEVVAFREEDDVRDVIDTMVDLRVGAVPVIKQRGKELVGIVSSIDLLRAARGKL